MNQTQKTLATLVGLLIVAGALGLFAWKGVYEPDEKAAEKKALDERLFGTSSKGRGADAGEAKLDFVKLTVRMGADVTVLERTPPEPWRLVSPVKAKADALVVDGLVSQLQTARFKTTLEGEATDAELKTYGLDEPHFTVEAEAVVDGAVKTVKLEGGIENPFDGTVYMRKDGSRVVHMAEGGVRWAFAKTTFDLRDKELFVVDDGKLEKVTLKTKNNDWELARGEDKLWRLTRPESTLADSTSVNAMLGLIRGTRASAFKDDTSPPALEALGFGDPLATMVFTVAGAPVTFRLASPPRKSGDEQKLFVLREGGDGPALGELNLDAKAAFDRNALDLRDKALIAFSKANVTKLVLEAPGAEPVVLEKASADASVEAWRLTSPKVGAAKAYKIATALWTLGSLRSGVAVLDKPDAKGLELYGLGPKQARVITVSGPGGALAKLSIGKDVVGKQGQSYGVGTRGAIVEFDNSRINELPWKADDLLDLAADAGTP